MKGKSKGKSQKAKVKSSAVAGLLLFFCGCVWAPCITATTECTEWLTFGGGPSRSLFYRTYSLEGRHENITRALIVIHGAGRDANNYFRTGVAAAFLDGALEDTIVIAPRFASSEGGACRDKLDQDEVSWSCSGDSWRSGRFVSPEDAPRWWP